MPGWNPRSWSGWQGAQRPQAKPAGNRPTLPLLTPTSPVGPRPWRWRFRDRGLRHYSPEMVSSEANEKNRVTSSALPCAFWRPAGQSRSLNSSLMTMFSTFLGEDWRKRRKMEQKRISSSFVLRRENDLVNYVKQQLQGQNQPSQFTKKNEVWVRELKPQTKWNTQDSKSLHKAHN